MLIDEPGYKRGYEYETKPRPIGTEFDHVYVIRAWPHGSSSRTYFSKWRYRIKDHANGGSLETLEPLENEEIQPLGQIMDVWRISADPAERTFAASPSRI